MSRVLNLQHSESEGGRKPLLCTHKKNLNRPILREVNEIESTQISDFLKIPRTPPSRARDNIGELNSNRKSVDLNEVPQIFRTPSNSAQLLKPNLADRALRKDLVKSIGRECNGFKRLNSWVSYEGLLGSYSLILFALKSKNFLGKNYFSFFSKEGSILVNNLIMVIVCASVFFGTIYPLIVEIFTSNRISVGEPYFNATVIPMIIPAILVMGIGPLLSWNKADSKKTFKQIFFWWS